MKMVYELMTDTVLYGMQGLLFYYLISAVLETGIQSRAKKGKNIMVCILPFFLLRMAVTHSSIVQQFLYGKPEYIKNSRDSILGAALSFTVLLCCGLALGWRRRKLIFYLTLVYTAASEILRFGVFCLTAWLPELTISHLNRRIEKKAMALENFIQILDVVQIGWNLLFFCLYLLGMVWVIRRYRKFLVSVPRLPQGYELLYLMIPAAAGLCFGVLLRGILLSVRDGQIYRIFDGNSWLYVVVSAIAFLCVFLLLASIQIRCRLIEAEAEKGRSRIYQNQVEDMKSYIQDLEGVQEGIRGMRHDMKNYVADIQALFQLHWKMENQPGKYQEKTELKKELEGYVRGMNQALDGFALNWKTGNPVTDVIVNRFLQKARESDIETECEFAFPKELDIDPFDLSIILNNGLNNALEACQRLEGKKRFVSLKCRTRGQMFLLEIKNPVKKGSIRKIQGNRIQTVKEEPQDHGLGLGNIENCVKKYYGYLEWSEEDEVFRLSVMMQGRHL